MWKQRKIEKGSTTNQPDKHKAKHKEKQTDKHPDKHADIRSDKHTDTRTDKHTDIQTDTHADKPSDKRRKEDSPTRSKSYGKPGYWNKKLVELKERDPQRFVYPILDKFTWKLTDHAQVMILMLVKFLFYYLGLTRPISPGHNFTCDFCFANFFLNYKRHFSFRSVSDTFASTMINNYI